jgi:ATP-dependent Clp protease protease subunit
MQHQPSQRGGGGTAAEIEVLAKEILYTRSTVNRLLAKHTGQPVERIERDFERDNYMSAEEAKAYGMIDHVIQQRGELVDVPAMVAASTESSW